MSSGAEGSEQDPRAAEERFTDYLRRRGLVVTPQRLSVLNEAMATEGHFEADELHHRLRSAGSSASKATVYRTLELLVASGVLRQVSLGDRRSHYEHAVGHRHHDHLVCVRCGRIIEFTSPSLEDMQRKVCRKHHFTPLGHRMRIMGFCEACSGRERQT